MATERREINQDSAFLYLFFFAFLFPFFVLLPVSGSRLTANSILASEALRGESGGKTRKEEAIKSSGFNQPTLLFTPLFRGRLLSHS